MELLLTKRAPTTAHTDILVKFISSQIKTWTVQFENAAFTKRNQHAPTNRSPVGFVEKVRDVIVQEVLNSFALSMKRYTNRLALWKKLADKAEMDVDMTFQTTFDDTERTELARLWPDAKEVILDLDAVKETWNVWNSFAGCLSHLVHHMDTTEEVEWSEL
jgi:hypothetical protein